MVLQKMACATPWAVRAIAATKIVGLPCNKLSSPIVWNTPIIQCA